MSVIQKSVAVKLISANSAIEEIEKFLDGTGETFVKLVDHEFYAGYMSYGDGTGEIHYEDYVRLNDYFVSVDGVVWSKPQSIASLVNMGLMS